MNNYKGLLFDLDGVLVDTAKYHYLAWKALADELKIPFTPKDNERLKGVSRTASFDIILELGNRKMDDLEKAANCQKKNDLYVSYIQQLTEKELLGGVREFIRDARSKGYQIALGSASKNSPLILDKLGIADLFDALVDGTKVSRAKPDPEVFLRGAQELCLPAGACVVFEDAVAGISAAHNAGMKAVGIGSPDILAKADTVLPGFSGLCIDDVLAKLQ